jgi:hypothetical protein
MRAALVILFAVVAACGGGSKSVTPITNVAVPEVHPWTAARVRATLPPDASVVIKVETAPIRTSEVVGPMWAQLSASSFKKMGTCQEIADLDATMVVVVSGTEAMPAFSVWMLDTPAATVRRCMEKTAAAPPEKLQVTIDGDFASITGGPGGARGGVLFLDDSTVVMSFEKSPTFDRAHLLAATQERHDALADPALDELFASSAPVWGYGTAASPMLASLAAGKFRTFAVTVGLSKLMTVDARVRMTAPDKASDAANMVSSQGGAVVQMGMIDEIKASAEDDTLVVHAVFSKASIDKLMSMMGGMLGGGGGSMPFGPPTGP